MARMVRWRKENPQQRTVLRRRERTRRRLREMGVLPPVGVDMDEIQRDIFEQIGNDDYTYWDSVKKGGKAGKLHDGGNQSVNIKRTINKTLEELIWDRAKQSSQQRGLEFTIEVEDIIIPQFCPLLNIELTFVYTKETRDSYYSIDRIDSSKGYIKGNVQIISLSPRMFLISSHKSSLIYFRNLCRC
jgi:hypothetical protein